MLDFQPKIACELAVNRPGPHLNPLPQGEEDAQNKGSIAETDLDVTGGLNHLAIGRDQPQTIDRVGDGDVADLIVLIADHRSEMSFVCQLHCFHAEARAENPVERSGRTAAL